MRITALVIATLATALPAYAAEPFAKIAEIQIGGLGRFDYLNVDSAAHRLYVSHGTEAVVIDTSTNSIVGRIDNTPGIHGIDVAPELGIGFTTNGGENKVGILDLKTLATKTKVETGANPDNLLYISSQKQLWSFNHTGHSLTVIDAVKGTTIATTPLSGDDEGGQADVALGKVFINIEDKNSIDVVDMKTYAVVANYPVAPATEPTGMAIDTANHRLFVGGGDALVMIDTHNGKVLGSVPICKGTDSTWFDAGISTAFVSCSDGHITVVTVKGDSLAVVQTLETARGARTMTIDQATHRLYTAAVEYLPADPANPKARPQAREGSMKVLVFGQGK